ncbi:NACHT, LRR and PYD domains-containing protein 3 [Holothuria leucospilota]|uniref:NACHT, LRR and PYD domains-containing protein 3 n=1 Tax=Holothuria leucospilota TaxID=206669 RepID=A0A9Q1CP74_HOLLE|nr:NACHT, LRR and PYD domains-containing protein 3 [Holothuria leucospilota]
MMECGKSREAALPKELSSEEDWTEKKIQFAKELRKKYKKLCGRILPAMFMYDKYVIESLYVDSGVEFLEEKQEGEDRETWAKLKNYKMVFTDPRVKSKRRIVEGEEGSGKSSLAFQMTNDWRQGKDWMKDFEVLILLQLRQFKKSPTVYKAIREFLLLRDSKLTEADIKNILDSSSALFILDEFDEYPGRGKRDTDIECIIKGDMLQNHEVILLTKPSCLPLAPSDDAKRIRLTGFDKAARFSYILNQVVGGDSAKAEEINKFIEQNPVTSELYRVPLLFVLISHMVKEDAHQDFQTLTELFSRVIACFHSQGQRSNTTNHRDHSKLDKVAFEALRGDPQKIIWNENELRSKIGDDLYDEYITIGILREEEVFDDDASGYKTKTRFFYRLFAEWYAAHYFANEAAWPEAGSEPGPSPLDQTSERSQDRSVNGKDVHRLSTIDVNYVHFMCRFACGLNNETALKIIKHSGVDLPCYTHTLSCIAEWKKKWGGSFEMIEDKVREICSDTLSISGKDSLLLQTTTLKLIKFASSRKGMDGTREGVQIPISWMELQNCLDGGPYNCILCVRPTNQFFPIANTSIGVLWIWEHGSLITKRITDSILWLSGRFLGVEEVWFRFTYPPFNMVQNSTLSLLRQKNVKVVWYADNFRAYHLNLESGQWEY